MDDRDLAEKLLQNHFTAAAALIALMLKNLPDGVRTRTLDAVRNGTGKVELRTRIEANETELVLVPADGSEPLWLARTPSKRPVRAESFKAADASGDEYMIDVLIEQIDGRDGYVQRRLRTGEPVRAYSEKEFEATRDGKLLRLRRLP